MSKQLRIIVISLVAVGLIGLGYFVGLPQSQGSAYIASVKTKHADVQTDATKLKGLFDLDLFKKTDQTSDEIRVDVKNATKVIDAVKDKLAANSDTLTKFTEYPLLSWHPVYKDSIELNTLEKKYTDNVRKAANEFEAVIAYFDSSADIGTKIEAASVDLTTITSNEELVKAFEKAAAATKEGVASFEKLSVPESLKDYQEAFLAHNKRGLVLLEAFVAALKAGDEAKMNSTGEQLSKLGDETDTLGKEHLKKFVEKSVLRQYIDAAADADQQIAKLLAK